MNILFIGHEQDMNGASLSMVALIDELKKKGHNVFVLSSYKEGKFIDELRKRDTEIIYAKYYRWMIYKNQQYWKWAIKRFINLVLCQINYISAFKLKRVIKEKEINIIHTNTGVINIGGILSKICKVKHVWHIREFGEEDFNFHYIYPKKYSMKFIEKNSDKVIAISKAIFEKYNQYIDKNKICTIYNGIDKKYMQKRKFTINEKFNMIMCGRIGEAKGQRDAISALNYLKKKGYKNIYLYLAGSGNCEFEKNLIKEYELEDKVIFLGRIDNLMEIRSTMDVELVCSKCEAFGRVTIEAMMSMLPVIGANTGGTKELVIDGYNGYLYEQGNSIELANKIETMILNKDLTYLLSQNAYDYSNDFSSENNADNIVKLYYKLLDKTSN